jgi:hypothetical protein
MAIPPILTALAALAVVLTAIFVFIKNAREAVAGVWTWLMGPMHSTLSRHKVDLRITPDRTGFCQWSEGSRAGKPIMMVTCKLQLSNVGPTTGFQILDVSIKKPKTQGHPLPSQWQRMRPRLPEAPPDTRLAVPFEAIFTVEPPVVKSGEKFVADIILMDQFAKKHVAKRVEFTAMGGPAWENLAKMQTPENKPGTSG